MNLDSWRHTSMYAAIATISSLDNFEFFSLGWFVFFLIGVLCLHYAMPGLEGGGKKTILTFNFKKEKKP